MFDKLKERTMAGGRRLSRVFAIAAVSAGLFALPLVPLGDAVPDGGPIGTASAVVGDAVDSLGLGIETADAKWRNCGWSSCTDYLTRAETKAKARQLRRAGATVSSVWNSSCWAIGGLFGLISPAGGVITGLSCYAAKARLDSQIRTIKTAARKGQCFEMRFPRYGSNNPAFALGWGYTNHPRYCR